MLAGRSLLAVLLSSSCQSEPGELDREVVLALSRTRGLAEGTERTGRYLVRPSIERCECGPTSVDAFAVGASLCGPALQLAEAGTDVEVVETDGLLLVRVPGVGSMTGPIELDGTFSVGAVFDLGSPVSTGSIVLRADGVFRDEDFVAHPPYTAWAVEGSLRRRLVGEFADESTDCIESVFVEDAREP